MFNKWNKYFTRSNVLLINTLHHNFLEHSCVTKYFIKIELRKLHFSVVFIE